MRPRLLGEDQVRARVARADEASLVALFQAFERVLADRHKHSESGLARDLRLPHETVLDEAAQHVEDISAAELLRRPADLLDLREHPAAHKDREPREKLALRWIQEIPAPRDRPAQGALPLRQIARGRRQQVQSLTELREHRLRREYL